jgi:hypothetical protein
MLLTWGGGYRQSWDRVANAPDIGFLPGDLDLHWANLFAQDEYAAAPGLKLTAGAEDRAQQLHRRRVPAQPAPGVDAGRPPN